MAYAANQTRWREQNRDRRRELNRQSQSRCSETHAKSEQSRRARKHNAFIEEVDPQILWERDEGVCGLCRQPCDPQNWEMDHIIPLKRGGKHSYANTQVSHPVCNRRKGAKAVV
jgi:5-methylcytosine-specific restriction endonuclease McrA